MKPTRAQIRFLNECSTPIPETSEQASKLITAMLNNPTIPAQTTAPAATHTPGPWSASHNGNDDVRVFANSVSDSPRCIAKVNTPLNRGLESCANARLIAAAPELLSGLESARFALAESGFGPTGMSQSELINLVYKLRENQALASEFINAAITQATL